MPVEKEGGEETEEVVEEKKDEVEVGARKVEFLNLLYYLNVAYLGCPKKFRIAKYLKIRKIVNYEKNRQTMSLPFNEFSEKKSDS